MICSLPHGINIVVRIQAQIVEHLAVHARDWDAAENGAVAPRPHCVFARSQTLVAVQIEHVMTKHADVPQRDRRRVRVHEGHARVAVKAYDRAAVVVIDDSLP